MLAVTGLGSVLAPADPDPDWFDVRAELGARGYKYLPPAARYLLAAARRAVADGGGLAHVDADRRGVAVATNAGLAALLDDLDAMVVAGRTAELSPAMAPFFAVNVTASRLAAEQELRAFTLTLTSPRVAGLEAVQVGARALAAGRCEALLVAAVEEPPPHATAAEAGAVTLLLEPEASARRRGAGVYGRCGVRTAFVPSALLGGAEGERRLRDLVERALTGLEAKPASVHAVLDDSPVSDGVHRALSAVLPGPAERIGAEAVGSGCLTPVRRLASLLRGEPGERLLVAASAQGNVAFARIDRVLGDRDDD